MQAEHKAHEKSRNRRHHKLLKTDGKSPLAHKQGRRSKSSQLIQAEKDNYQSADIRKKLLIPTEEPSDSPHPKAQQEERKPNTCHKKDRVDDHFYSAEAMLCI